MKVFSYYSFSSQLNPRRFSDCRMDKVSNWKIRFRFAMSVCHSRYFTSKLTFLVLKHKFFKRYLEKRHTQCEQRQTFFTLLEIFFWFSQTFTGKKKNHSEFVNAFFRIKHQKKKKKKSDQMTDRQSNSNISSDIKDM